MTPRQLGEKKQWHLRRLRERLVAVPGEARQRGEKVLGSHHELVMVCLGTGGGNTRQRALVVQRVVESDREARERARSGFAHQTQDGRRVDASAQENSERNVTHEPFGDGIEQERSELFRSHVAFWLRVDAPISPDLLACVFEGRDVSRLEPGDPFEERPRPAHIALEEKLAEVLGLNFGLPAAGEKH